MEIATTAVFEYIEVFYNRQRLHSSINDLSPATYEATYLSPPGHQLPSKPGREVGQCQCAPGSVARRPDFPAHDVRKSGDRTNTRSASTRRMPLSRNTGKTAESSNPELLTNDMNAW